MNQEAEILEKMLSSLKRSLKKMGAKNVKVTHITDASVILSFDYEDEHLSAIIAL